MLLIEWHTQHIKHLEWYVSVILGSPCSICELLDKDPVCPTWRSNRKNREDLRSLGLMDELYKIYWKPNPPLAVGGPVSSLLRDCIYCLSFEQSLEEWTLDQDPLLTKM